MIVNMDEVVRKALERTKTISPDMQRVLRTLVDFYLEWNDLLAYLREKNLTTDFRNWQENRRGKTKVEEK